MNPKLLALVAVGFLVAACAPGNNEVQSTPEASSETASTRQAAAPPTAQSPSQSQTTAPPRFEAPQPRAASPEVNEADDSFKLADQSEPQRPAPAAPRAEQVPLPRPHPAAAPVAAEPAPAQVKVVGMDALQRELLGLINQSRAHAGLAPLKFEAQESRGTDRCVGSLGHSQHMAQTRRMSHDQFPADICIRTRSSGENVGYSGGSASEALREIHQMMMDEGPSGGHYQNIMGASYNRVGLGVYYADGTLWLTEDFVLE